MKLKIIETRPKNHSIPRKFRIVNAETGEILEGVIRISNNISFNGVSTSVEFNGLDYEIEYE